MNNSELMLAAITNGLEDDATTSAALDAIREESNCTLLAAVLEVARVHKAACDARDVKEAQAFLAAGSDIRDELYQEIFAECPSIPPGASANILVIEGSDWPQTERTQPASPAVAIRDYFVSVGAIWVKRVASRLMLEHQRAAYRPRRRRSC